MKKETSVSWLLDQYLKKDGLAKSDFIKAFEVEKQQIIDAYIEGDADSYYCKDNRDRMGENYYTETFKPGQDERFK